MLLLAYQEIIVISIHFANHLENNFDIVGDDHVSNSCETPIRKDAFDISNEKKKEIIAEHFKVIMETLGLDLTEIFSKCVAGNGANNKPIPCIESSGRSQK